MGHTDLATYSNTGQAVDKWTAESVRELVMDCSRRGREDGDGCWHIEGEPQHWQRLADELNAVNNLTRQAGSTSTELKNGAELNSGAGRGTCRNTVEKIPGEMPRLHCSNCNAITTLDIPDQMAESYMAWPKFCASCGARATEVD